MVVLAISLPIAMKLVQQNTENRSHASYIPVTCNYALYIYGGGNSVSKTANVNDQFAGLLGCDKTLAVQNPGNETVVQNEALYVCDSTGNWALQDMSAENIACSSYDCSGRCNSNSNCVWFDMAPASTGCKTKKDTCVYWGCDAAKGQTCNQRNGVCEGGNDNGGGTATAGNVSRGGSCKSTSECTSGMVCVNGSCDYYNQKDGSDNKCNINEQCNSKNCVANRCVESDAKCNHFGGDNGCSSNQVCTWPGGDLSYWTCMDACGSSVGECKYESTAANKSSSSWECRGPRYDEGNNVTAKCSVSVVAPVVTPCHDGDFIIGECVAGGTRTVVKNSLSSCNDNYVPSTKCTYTAAAVKICNPNKKQCSGNVLQTCNSVGTALTNDTTCAACRNSGDVNNDGTVNSTDADLIGKAAVGQVTLTDTQKIAADVNNDGTITSSDGLLALQNPGNVMAQCYTAPVVVATPKISFKFAFDGIKPARACISSLGKLGVEVGNVSTRGYQSLPGVSYSVVKDAVDSNGNQVFEVDGLALDSSKFASVDNHNYVKIKGPFHIKRRMCVDGQSGKLDSDTAVCNIDLTNTDHVYDFSKYLLLAGDVNKDGAINSVDFSYVKTRIDAGSDITCGREGDLNADGVVNSGDIGLVKNALLSVDDE